MFAQEAQQQLQAAPLRIVKAEVLVYRAPVTEPVQTSFGIMYDRPAVFIRLEDADGTVGWGEIWSNFPGVGAEHRARVFESCVAPILMERTWANPVDAFAELSRRLYVLGIQTGEPGTMAQAIGGADIALWDLAGKRLQQPLWKLFGGSATIGTYASGLSPTGPEKLATLKREEGYRAFKLKVGFGAERDMANLRTLREMLGAGTDIMIDANQAWDIDTAAAMSARLSEFAPVWLEEPITADHNIAAWKDLAARSPIPLAAGENMRGDAAFDEAIGSKAFAVMQPDLGKWGGFSGCVPVGQRAVAAGLRFCPHWLGGGIGLIASMQLKAAVGGPGFVEVDSNPNPLRDVLAAAFLRPVEGKVTMPDAPGLGLEPDLDAVKAFRVAHRYG